MQDVPLKTGLSVARKQVCSDSGLPKRQQHCCLRRADGTPHFLLWSPPAFQPSLLWRVTNSKLSCGLDERQIGEETTEPIGLSVKESAQPATACRDRALFSTEDRTQDYCDVDATVLRLTNRGQVQKDYRLSSLAIITAI